ncbi:DUF302 domain-containing protein [Aurantimonas sp. A2-1-M11]|uniref:DUF302 domain-containing protein n=1 Tax=Aurantimonas sp. A2-1-M11 TaxID=3113712 RepID=UPI002F952F14
MLRTIHEKTSSAVLVALLLTASAAAQSAHEGITVRTIEAPFEDVRHDVLDAIVNRGFVIDYEAMIGEMLDRTAADVGADDKVYAHADTMQFCSAVLSRAAIEADPANIAYCPYVIFVYELAGQPGSIQVGFRHLPVRGSDASKTALSEINSLLEEIVAEATASGK